MVVQTGRFGEVTIDESEIIHLSAGILGFCDETEFCLIDPNDDTLILWLQSLKNPKFALPVLEPKIFKKDYLVRLSLSEMREMDLVKLSEAVVFCVLTIPVSDITQMSANLKAPVVINLKNQKSKQVILQENDYVVRYPIFKDLRAHLLTIGSNHNRLNDGVGAVSKKGPIKISTLRPAEMLRTL